MKPRSRSTAKGGRNRGFALIIVLWTLVLIAFIAAHLVARGRVEVRIAGNLAASAVTNAAADGAVYRAIFNLLDPRPEGRWPLDGSTHAVAIGDCRVTVELRNEAALLNPNLASPNLIEALLRVTGSDAETARRLAEAIGDWVGSGPATRSPDALLAEYRAAGLDYGPPGEPLETLDELQQVHGMTPSIFAAVRPHLSLFAPGLPVLADADPVVTTAMAETGTAEPGQGGAARPQADVATVRIAAAAQGPNNAQAARTAVVRIVPRSLSFVVLGWDDSGG